MADECDSTENLNRIAARGTDSGAAASAALVGIGLAQESVVVNPARVSIRLTPECWRFVYDARSWPVLIRLPVDVQAVLDDIPPLEVSGAIPEPRIVVTMTRPQAEALERWLHALHDDLQYDDARRLTCLLCISGVAVAIMLSER
jgi:hypothetical protein